MSVAAQKVMPVLPSHGAYSTSVADKVARLSVLLKRALGAFARRHFDLSVVEARLIILIGIHARTTVNELANLSDIDRTQISRALSVLSERRLVSKTSSESDRRAVFVTLTKNGAKVHDAVIEFLFQHNSDLIAAVPVKSLETFFSVMKILIDRAQQTE